MPKVSIVLPTYNRADVLARALASVARQSYTDWELIVVDDGSADSTEAIVKESGVAVRYLRAQHGGVSAARNLGIRESESEYVAFLDSDDAWNPSYLSVCAGFLDDHPGEALVATELLQDFGHGLTTLHPIAFVRGLYPKLALRVGSHALDLPPGESDPYLRIFSRRIDVTDWLTRASGNRPSGQVFRYWGNIFPHFRWGYPFSVAASVLRRFAITEVGAFDESLSSGEDFSLLAEVCRRYHANFFAWPGYTKHEFGQEGLAQQEGHLATAGWKVVEFHINLLRVFDALYDAKESADQELRRLRGYKLYTIGDHALKLGDHRLARQYFEESVQFFPEFIAARGGLLLTKIMPAVGAKLYGPAGRVLATGGRIVRGRFSIRGFGRRLLQSKQKG